MPPSYRMINYGLRPAKHIERKMLVEVFRRLSEFGSVHKYRYVGFGSVYFTDFALFHRVLGITDMVSIEFDSPQRNRFEFNRPFSCIDMEFGHSNKVLPRLKWDARTILWLDYDGPLTGGVITDVTFFCANAAPGSVILVSVNAESDVVSEEDEADDPEDESDDADSDSTDGDLAAALGKKIGADRVPAGLKNRDFGGWGTASIIRRIIHNQIEETITRRNGTRAKSAQLIYRQLFNIHYRDNARMLTVGGVVFDDGQFGAFAKCSFGELPFVKTDENAYLIEAPNLTKRELRHIESQLPIDDYGALETEGISASDVEKFARVYRYFPTFAEADVL